MTAPRPHGSAVLDEPEQRRRSGRGLGYATRVQVTAHQFNARRAALGLTLRRVRMESEPGRRQSMAILASITLTAVICLGALFWSFLRPAGSVGDAAIIADQDTGALYVRVGETLYPALNLASARLIAGTAANPVRVRRSEIDTRPRGAMVGIPGAPTTLNPTTPLRSSWLVCDAVTKAFGAGAPEPVTVTVIDGQPDLSERRRTLDKQDAALLRYGEDVWLIRDGRRSKVDPSQRPVLLALGVPGDAITTARPMSRALFDAIPVGPALTVPAIPNAGAPAHFPNAPGPVGTVVSTPQVGGANTYSVVLTDGVQQVSPVVAQIMQNATGTAAPMPVVPGPALAEMPSVTTLDTSVYPDEALHLVDTQANPATCWWWQRADGDPKATTTVVSGPTIPVPADKAGQAVSMVKADKNGAQADRVYFGPDYANYVVSTGNDPAAATAEALWWVSESGVRFGVDRDPETLRALGLGTPPRPAPWSVLALLANGPTLSKADALVRHDTLPVDMNVQKLEQPR
jgi:type VII secretion protein EccB